MNVLTQLAEDIPLEDLRLVLKTFEDDMQRLSQAMSAAAATSDFASFRRAAHSLAGAAGAVGAVALEDRARGVMKLPDGETTAADAAAADVAGLASDAILLLRRFAATDLGGS